MTSLYDPIVLGDMRLSNRVFMAPLTRNRATPSGVPDPWASTYYSQRASAGLIVSEATQILPMGKGYINTPGIHSQEQIAGWKPVVEAVHRSGGRIFLQLWHVGRISHSSLLPENASPVAPSSIRARAQTVVETGFVDVSEPRALSLTEIRRTIEDYGRAASNAKATGFDGVEIHAANGYLIDQFLRSKSNVRTDTYGGSAANRVLFLGEVVVAVLGVWERTRVGVRCGCAQPASARIPARRGRHYPGRSQGGLFPTLALGMEGDLCRQRRIRC
jgi:N-ethylmaleimide reductase